MAGNSRRQGARRSPGTKKGPTVGSGGQQPKGLRGKGPTPRAEDREKAAKRAGSTRRAARPARPSGSPASSGQPGPRHGRTPRADSEVEVVAGRNPVVEALRARVPATALFVADRLDADARVKEAVQLATEERLRVASVSRPELDRMTAGAVHQGVALQVPAYHYAHPGDLARRALDSGAAPLLVALDSVTDPRNLGAVVRSAAAFGAHGVVVPERRSAGMTVGAWKTSAGAAAHVPVARATNLTRQLEDYRKAGLVVVGLAANGSVDLYDLEVAVDPLVVVLGSEGGGLSRLVERACDALVRIPMPGRAESLNAGVAAGIVLYEISRRRSSHGHSQPPG
jgi:23S rRNA (guanosine2251-2'-O)-methyltransferase